MNPKLTEIGQELKSVIASRGLIVLILPLVFTLTNAAFGLTVAAISTLGLGFVVLILKLIRKQPWGYSLAGLFLVLVAIGLTLLTQNAINYFLPALITSALTFLASLVSLLMGKPLAAWASHLTRGWPLTWFWRSDVLPAYREVTLAWAVFFLFRLALQTTLFIKGEIATLAWMETLLGWVVTVAVLVASYIYGTWRLRQLGGPGVDEFLAGTEPPWNGQTRGF